MNDYDMARKECLKYINNVELKEESRMMASLNYTFISLSEELNNINTNLEKIANNTEKTEIYFQPVLPNKCELYGPVKKELNLDTIICNKNRDSYVDKNIIS